MRKEVALSGQSIMILWDHNSEGIPKWNISEEMSYVAMCLKKPMAVQNHRMWPHIEDCCKLKISK